MYDPKEWKQARDMTVSELITYMRNHFDMGATVHVDGDNFFYFHMEEDRSAISFDSSSLGEDYPEDVEESVVNMEEEYEAMRKKRNEVYSEVMSDILKYRDFRLNVSSDKFRDDFYRVIEIDGWEGNVIEDKFNMLKHDGFIFKEAVPITRSCEGRESKVTMLIFVRESHYM